jgi:hypothetical protein
VLEHRKELVVAALTILRAHAMAGRPRDEAIQNWGGFDAWIDQICAAVVWAGLPNPCLSRASVATSDPDRDLTVTVLAAWHRTFDEPITLAGLVKQCNAEPGLLSDPVAEFRAALLAVAANDKDATAVDGKRLGYWCRTFADRWIGGYRLVRAKENDSKKANTWRIESK